jgi:hypothetical protein
MTRSRQSRKVRVVAAATSRVPPSFDHDFDEDENLDTNENITSTQGKNSSTIENENVSPIDEDHANILIDKDVEEHRLKANVWHYARKITSEKAQCNKCKMYIKTAHSGTTTLRKHLIMKHKLTHLTSDGPSRVKPNNSISREQKNASRLSCKYSNIRRWSNIWRLTSKWYS